MSIVVKKKRGRPRKQTSVAGPKKPSGNRKIRAKLSGASTKKKEYKLFTNPPEPVTWNSLMQWLADSGWVEGRIGRKISPLDRQFFDDYVQEVWIQILEVPKDKMMDIWTRGKGRFIEYVKSIIMNNIYSNSSHLYKNIRYWRQVERTLTDEQWKRLDDEGESDYEVTFPINDFDNNNRALHYGVDIMKCKTDEQYRIDQEN